MIGSDRIMILRYCAPQMVFRLDTTCATNTSISLTTRQYRHTPVADRVRK